MRSQRSRCNCGITSTRPISVLSGYGTGAQQATALKLAQETQEEAALGRDGDALAGQCGALARFLRDGEAWSLAPSRTIHLLRDAGGCQAERRDLFSVKHENGSQTQEHRRRCGTELKGARGSWPLERLRLIAAPLRGESAAGLRAEPPTRSTTLGLHTAKCQHILVVGFGPMRGWPGRALDSHLVLTPS